MAAFITAAIYATPFFLLCGVHSLQSFNSYQSLPEDDKITGLLDDHAFVEGVSQELSVVPSKPIHDITAVKTPLQEHFSEWAVDELVQEGDGERSPTEGDGMNWGDDPLPNWDDPLPSTWAKADLFANESSIPGKDIAAPGRNATWNATSMRAVPHLQTVVELQNGQGSLDGMCFEQKGLDTAEWLPNCQWLGIPYAAPPIETLRWKPPMPPVSWEGVRDAKAWGPNCAQLGEKKWDTRNGTHHWNETTKISKGMNQGGFGSEDCLYLNVFAPPIRNNPDTGVPDPEYPVMIFIHGGGFEAGASDENHINPKGLIELLGNVVVVTFNYRLGLFGFLGSQELRSRDPANSTGTYGLQDMIHATKWAKANAPTFGGNPDRILLFGESSGAGAIADLLSSPYVDAQLIQTAIMESGGFARWNARKMETAQESFEKLKGYIGCNASHFTTDDVLKCFENTDMTTLLKAQLKKYPVPFGLASTTWAPAVDGVVLPYHPREALLHGAVKQGVHLILGSNRDEGSLFTSYGKSGHVPKQFRPRKNMTRGEFVDWANSTFGAGNGEQLAEMYKPATAEEAKADPIHAIPTWYWGAARAAGDYMMVCPAQQAARLLDYYGNPSWLYQFECLTNVKSGGADWAVNTTDNQTKRLDVDWISKGMGASHGSEIIYVFHDLRYLKKYDERKLSRKIARYWSNLAYTGNPNAGPSRDLVRLPETPEHWTQLGSTVKDLNDDHVMAFRCPDSSLVKSIKARCRWWGQYEAADVALTNIEKTLKLHMHKDDANTFQGPASFGIPPSSS